MQQGTLPAQRQFPIRWAAGGVHDNLVGEIAGTSIQDGDRRKLQALDPVGGGQLNSPGLSGVLRGVDPVGGQIRALMASSQLLHCELVRHTRQMSCKP